LINFQKFISELQIDKGVYRPNESSIEITKAALTCRKKFLEIGTGSGFTSIILYLNGFDGIATDISYRAIECAQNNFLKFKINAVPIISDLFENINDKFDLIIFNPPTNINEDEKERTLKNYLKVIIPGIFLNKVKSFYQSTYARKRRRYLLSFIEASEEYLCDGGVTLINFIKNDVCYFKNKLKNYNVKIYSSNNESSVFLIKRRT
jgi:SAM-dependent methyltransferase